MIFPRKIKKLLISLISILTVYSLYQKFIFIKPNVDYLTIAKDSEKFQNFINLHNSIVRKNEKEIKRITFAKVYPGGYGNRVFSVLSSILIAIIADTALKIEWEEIDKYIESPLEDVFKKFDSNLQFSLNYKNQLNTYNVQAMSDNDWLYDKRLNYLLNKYIPLDKERYLYSDCRPIFFTLCANPTYFDKLLDYGLVDIETIKKANEAIGKKPSNITEGERVHLLYNVGFQFATNVLKEIWFIKPTLMNEINQIYDNEFKDNFVIGIQFRFSYIDEADIGNFTNCAIHIAEINNAKNVKWFITSDEEKIFKLLEKNYGKMIIRGKGKIGHVANNVDSYSRSIMDVELLSRSNEMIISGGSTFGFAAAIRKNKLPYYIEGRRKIETNIPCMRMTFDKPARAIYGPFPNLGVI